MPIKTHLTAWSDENGNVIEYDGPPNGHVVVVFGGSNNRLVVHADARFGAGTWNINFDNSNGLVKIGHSRGVPALRPSIRVGQDARVILGNKVSSTSRFVISAAEGTLVKLGRDVMLSTENQIRADDGHPIFDIATGKRVNVSRDIRIGSHVWLAWGVVVLGGVTIGEGTAVGVGSVVTRSLPNNVVAAGAPARVLRRDIAWERPHLTMREPYYKPDASTVAKSDFWRLTGDPAAFGHGFDREGSPRSGLVAFCRRTARRARRALVKR